MYYLIVSCETKFESTTHQVSLLNSSQSIKNTKETLKRGNIHIVYVRTWHTKWTKKFVTCSCANAGFLLFCTKNSEKYRFWYTYVRVESYVTCFFYLV